MDTNIDFEKICWVCLKEQAIMHSITASKVVIIMDKKETDVLVHDLLAYITSEQVLFNHGPSLICKNCTRQACAAYTFRKRCELSKSVFNEYGLTSSQAEISSSTTTQDSCNALEEGHLTLKIEAEDTQCLDLPTLKQTTCDQTMLTGDRKKHTVAKIFGCPYCLKKFRKKTYVKVHLRRHARGLPCICKICKESATSIAVYKDHVKEHDNKSIAVTAASEESLSRSEIIRELNRPPPKSRNATVVCTICGEQKSITRIKYHMMLHNNIKRHACLHCPRKFTDRSNLIVHMRIHTGDHPFVCKVCGKTFPHGTTYKVHLRVHDDIRPFKCHICAYSARTSARLKLHINRHEGIKNYHCSQCNYASCTNAELKDHLAKHSNDKCFLCKTCGKGFTRSKNLREHERSHNGIKRFSCDICNRRFTQRHSLRSHLKNIHSAILS